VGKINDFWSIICGKTPSKNNIQYFGWKIPFIKIPDMHWQTFIIKTEDTLTELWGNSQRNKFIPKGSICVSCIATVGLVSITSQNSQTNQQINSIIPSNEIHTEYLYYHMQSMKDKFIAIWSGGSATLNINTSTFLNIEIIIPNSEILQQFNKITKPIMQKILNNLTQISSLSQTRNELLPKLMSGKVRMKNLTLKQKHIN
jgi:type I restriction enzyme S subunit